MFGADELGPLDNDLILNYAKDGEPIGERIVVHGHVLDENGAAGAEHAGRGLAGQRRRPLPAQEGPLPRADRPELRRLRPHADRRERLLRLPHRSSPGAYPWRNCVNDWRPAHIHFSIFGAGFAQRLITQMYFEGDPLIPHCPILGTIPDADAIAAADRAARPQRRRAARQPRLPLRHRAARPPRDAVREQACRGTEPCIAAAAPISSETAVADRRPLRPHRPRRRSGRLRHLREQLRQRARRRRRRKGERIRIEGRVFDGTGTPVRTC